jgi:Undecaprenyl-phosphate galactose phosphotransferase WbaP
MPVSELTSASFVTPSRATARRAQRTLKRAFDITAAALLLFILLPLMAGLALLVRLSDGGPALFQHNRIGLGGRPFRCLKFRSMVPNAEAVLKEHLARNSKAREEWEAAQKLSHDPRITPLGRFLRKTSLDELPQLFNVLMGDMSLVGPRPIVPDEAARYRDQLRSYIAVRPGITGLWQVSGRSECTYPERVALDVLYVRKWSLLLDVVILARTVPAVLAQRGSY